MMIFFYKGIGYMVSIEKMVLHDEGPMEENGKTSDDVNNGE